MLWDVHSAGRAGRDSGSGEKRAPPSDLASETNNES